MKCCVQAIGGHCKYTTFTTRNEQRLGLQDRSNYTDTSSYICTQIHITLVLYSKVCSPPKNVKILQKNK